VHTRHAYTECSKDAAEQRTANERQQIAMLERQRFTQVETEKRLSSRLAELEQQLLRLTDEEVALKAQSESVSGTSTVVMKTDVVHSLMPILLV
jgi:hypothetical protein